MSKDAPYSHKDLIFDPLMERVDDFFEQVVEQPKVADKSPQEQSGLLKKINKVLLSGKDYDKALKSSDEEVKEVLSEPQLDQDAKSLKRLVGDYFKGPKNAFDRVKVGIVKGAVKADTFLSRLDGVSEDKRKKRLENLKKKYDATDSLDVQNLGTEGDEKPMSIKQIGEIIKDIFNESAQTTPDRVLNKKEQLRIAQEEERQREQERVAKEEVQRQEKKQIKEAAKDLTFSQWREIASSDYFDQSPLAGKLKIIEEAYISKLENLKEGVDIAKAAGIEMDGEELKRSGASEKDIKIIKEAGEFDIGIRDYMENQKAQKDLEEDRKPAARPKGRYTQRVEDERGGQEQAARQAEDPEQRARRYEDLAERGMESFYQINRNSDNERGGR